MSLAKLLILALRQGAINASTPAEPEHGTYKECPDCGRRYDVLVNECTGWFCPKWSPLVFKEY